MVLNQLYIDNIFCEDYISCLNKNYICEDKLSVSCVDNCFVVPFQSTPTGSPYGNGGCYDDQLNYVKSSGTYAENLLVEPESVNDAECDYVDETVIYAGYFIKHWGHFIVDFLPRMWWPALHYNGEKIIYLKNGDAAIDGNFMEMLKIFGIDPDKIKAIEKSTKFKKVIIPELALQRPDKIYREALLVRDRIVKNAAQCCKYDKVYLTRRSFPKAIDSEFGEEQVEEFFRDNGFKVLSPELLPVAEQVALFSSCPKIACLSGTIPHNIFFGNSDTELIIVNKLTRINTTQLMLNQLCGANVTFIDAFIQLLPVSPGAGPFWMLINDNMRKYAQDHAMVLAEKPIDYTDILIRYFLVYNRIYTYPLEKGGVIMGSPLPLDEGAERKDIFSYYRNKLGNINIDASVRVDSGENTKKLERRLKKENALKKCRRKCKDILRSLKRRLILKKEQICVEA